MGRIPTIGSQCIVRTAPRLSMLTNLVLPDRPPGETTADTECIREGDVGRQVYPGRQRRTSSPPSKATVNSKWVGQAPRDLGRRPHTRWDNGEHQVHARECRTSSGPGKTEAGIKPASKDNGKRQWTVLGLPSQDPFDVRHLLRGCT